MAVKLGSTKDNIKIIIRSDDALAEDLTDIEWESYKKSLDETKQEQKKALEQKVVKKALDVDLAGVYTVMDSKDNIDVDSEERLFEELDLLEDT